MAAPPSLFMFTTSVSTSQSLPSLSTSDCIHICNYEMAGPMLVRPSLTASTRIHSSATDVIKFLHPGYDAPNNILFALERVDPAPADSPTTFGVHHATALVGCQIIANNAWMGRLALDRKGEQPAGPHTSLDHVLTAKAYYFVIDGTRFNRRCAPLHPHTDNPS